MSEFYFKMWPLHCSYKIFSLKKHKHMASLSEWHKHTQPCFFIVKYMMGRDDKTVARLTGQVFGQLTALMQEFKIVTSVLLRIQVF